MFYSFHDNLIKNMLKLLSIFHNSIVIISGEEEFEL